MKLAIVATLVCPSLAAQDLQPVAFLAGEFEGGGHHAGGAYDETLTGAWELDGRVLTVRSASTMAGQTVFADLRVFSYDPARRRIRMRQFALGEVKEYDVVAKDNGDVVCTETGYEGTTRPEWRYTFTPRKEGFRYRVDAKGPSGFARYVGGDLRPVLPDPNEQGVLPGRIERKTIAGLDVELHVPQGDGPFPVLIFSPGGAARTTQGYSTFGRWFASWGFITAVVAFDESDVAARTGLFGKVADALTDPRIDMGRLAVGGHSLGGTAALLAAHADGRFKAVVALAPSGPRDLDVDKGPPALVVCGTRDDFLEVARALDDALPGRHYVIEIDGMNHMFAPSTAGMKVLGRATAFLKCHLVGDARYERFVTAANEGVTVRGTR